MDSVPEIIDRLGGVVAVANSRGLPVSTVGSWKSRSKIPSEEFTWIVERAAMLGAVEITFEALAKAHAKRACPAEPERAA